MNYIHPAPTEWEISTIVRCPVHDTYYTSIIDEFQPGISLPLKARKRITSNQFHLNLVVTGLAEAKQELQALNENIYKIPISSVKVFVSRC